MLDGLTALRSDVMPPSLFSLMTDPRCGNIIHKEFTNLLFESQGETDTSDARNIPPWVGSVRGLVVIFLLAPSPDRNSESNKGGEK